MPPAIAAVILAAAAWASPAGAQSAPASQPAPTIEVSVDARVELLSIIFRLAGAPEYTKAKLPAYAKDVDEHFAPVKDHPVIQTARRLREQYGVSYDAPMSLAVHLKDVGSLDLAVPLDPWPEGMDPRWKADELALFLQQARDFAAVGRFQVFFDSHQGLYDQTVSRARRSLADVHPEWFDSFFGTAPDCQFHLVLAMLNGPCGYGPRLRRQEREDVYCIMGVWSVDREGIPVFGRLVTALVVHEFSHSYVNPEVEKWAARFRKAARAIFRTQKQRMERMAYGNWQTMIIESMVRASVIRHQHRYAGALAARLTTMGEATQGFVWMGGLVDLLGEYERHRDQYPTLDAFMPRVVEFFDRYAASLAASTQPATQPATSPR